MDDTFLFIFWRIVYLYFSKIKNFLIIFLIFFSFSPLAYLYISISEKDKRTDYPGKIIANKVQQEWNKNFSNTIESVIGDEWHAGNLSYHLDSRPKWYTHSSAFVDKSMEDFVKTIGKNGFLIVNGECDHGISFIIENNKICMLGSK